MNFGISGDRLNKLLPLFAGIKNQRVLDVGCASGYLGKILKNNENYVVGIDTNTKDIIKAKKVLDKAYVVNLETDTLDRFHGKFDFILFTEVIEHLLDPEAVIKKVCKCLKPNGQILITTPNIVHIYLRYQFLLGKFIYKDETAINKFHIHFFSHATLKDLIKSIGFIVLKDNSLVFPRTLSCLWKFWPAMFVHTNIFLCEKK